VTTTYHVYWLTKAMEGHYVVISTKTATDELQGDEPIRRLIGIATT